MRNDREKPLYHISVVARLVDCHPQTLRTYERIGLVAPERSEANVRLYSDADIEKVRQIKRLTQELGVNLAGVEIVLRLLDRLERMETEIERLRGVVARGPRALGPAQRRGAKKVEVV
jgi:MerR family transcriptional regulator/heat shock protein HspR